MLEVVLCALSFWNMNPDPGTCTNLDEIPLNNEVIQECQITREQQDKFASGEYYYCEDEDGGHITVGSGYKE